MMRVAGLLFTLGLALVALGLQVAGVQDYILGNVLWFAGWACLIGSVVVLVIRRMRGGGLATDHQWPHLVWQQPGASAVTDLSHLRRHVNVLVRNVGGNARLTAVSAEGAGGRVYSFAHLVTPSVLPANEVILVRMFSDEDVEPYFWGDDTGTATPLEDEDIKVRIEYEDASHGERFETTIRLRARFGEAGATLKATAGPLPGEPEALLGTIVSCEFVDADPRPVAVRRRT